MRIGLIFCSANGTTEKITDLLIQHFESNGYTVEKINIGRSPYRENPEMVLQAAQKFDLIGLGSPVYHMDMLGPMLQLLKAFQTKDFNNNLKVFVYVSYSGITTGKAFMNTVKKLNRSQISIIGGLKIKAPHFHHKDDVLDIQKTKLIIKDFCEKLQRKDFDNLSFKKAKVLFSPEKARINVLFPIVHVVGKLRELPIKIDKSKCRQCGKCEKECPGGAITITEEAEIDFKKCLHCYHCVTVCPFQAITSPVHEIDQMIKVNKRVVGMENPSDKIYV